MTGKSRGFQQIARGLHIDAGLHAVTMNIRVNHRGKFQVRKTANQGNDIRAGRFLPPFNGHLPITSINPQGHPMGKASTRLFQKLRFAQGHRAQDDPLDARR